MRVCVRVLLCALECGVVLFLLLVLCLLRVEFMWCDVCCVLWCCVVILGVVCLILAGCW